MKLSISSELIKFQTNEFGQKLESVITRIKNEIENNDLNISQYDSDIKKNKSSNLSIYTESLPDIVKKYTGLTVEFDFTNGSPGAIFVFPFNRNSILLKDYIRNKYYIPGESTILQTSINVKGIVDLDKGIVGGIFSKYKHKMYVDFYINLALYQLTVRQVVAIMMHELGHAITYYEMSNKLSTTNQALNELNENLINGVDTPDKREYIFRELSGSLNLSNEKFTELLNENNRTILGYKMFKLYLEGVDSLRRDYKYDETSSEYIADNFAVKHGYGRDIIEALDKLSAGSIEKSNAAYYYAHFATILFDFIVVPIAIISSLGGIFMPIMLFIALLHFMATNINRKDMTYDDLKDRYTRIRNTMISQLKNRALPREISAQIIEDIELVDKIIDDTRKFESAFSAIVNFVTPSGRHTKNRINKDQLLEQLASNDLYLYATKFSNLK